MTQLVEALESLGLTADVELNGRWIRLAGERGGVFVTASPWGDSFYTWCDLSDERAVQRFDDPITAIQAGLRRASSQKTRPNGDAAE